jgi:hypothetical protein
LAALIARLLFLWLAGFYGRVANNDAFEYNRIADSLLGGYGFALGPGQPTAFRPFGYPFFLASIYALGLSVSGVQLCQAILGSLLVVPIYAIARRLINPWVAVLAGLGTALHPVLIYQVGLLAPETVAILLQLLLLWIALRVLQSSAARWPDVIGFVLVGVLAVLMRPELMLVTWLLVLGSIVQLDLMSGRGRALLVATVLVTILAMAPSVLRNWMVFDAFIPFPTVGGVTFWGGNNEMVSGGWVLPSESTWLEEDPPLGMNGWPELSERESQDRFYKDSFEWIKENPDEALALVPRKLVRSWALGYADEERANTLPPIVTGLNWAFGLVILAGVAMSLVRYRPLMWVLFAPVLAWIIKTIVFYGSARLTAPVLPVLCIFAALALFELGRFLQPLLIKSARFVARTWPR